VDNVKKMVLISTLTALAILINISETMILASLPAVKIGLSNIIILLVILNFSMKDALYVTILKSATIFFVFFNIYTFVLSITGGVISVLVMGLLYEKLKDYVSIVVISICGAIAHMSVQLLIVSLVIKSFNIMTIGKYLILLSVVSGFIIGKISEKLHEEKFLCKYM